MNLRDIPAPPDSHERRRTRRRGRAIQVVIAALFLTLVARLWYLQIAQGEEWRRASELNRIRIERKAAPRGNILDRNDILLAGTRPKFIVSVTPGQFNLYGPEGRRLAECLGIPLSELKVRAKPAGPGYRRVRVAVDVTRSTLAKLEEMKPWLPGVSVDLEDLRYYPLGKLAAHPLGYIGPISEEMLDKHPDAYSPDSRVGISGLERKYEPQLRGRDGGLVIEVDAAGRRTRLLKEEAPIRGDDLTLNIDANVQKAAEDGLTGRVGSAVAIDPRTGAVFALASRPAFDPNLFARGIGGKEWQAILNDPQLPLLDRAVQSAYPPGSTFKLITSLAGLTAGKITSHTSVYCRGVYYLGRHRFKDWRRHGQVDFYRAIAESCDVFFYTVGRSLGIDPISDMAKQFGLGEKTGIDLPGERAGTVPSTQWKRDRFPHDPVWHPGETLNAAIGQGYLQCTSLQIAMMAGGVAMHGKVYQPHIVRSIYDRAANKTVQIAPKLIHDVKLPDQYYDMLLEGMRQTVDSGTGRTAALPGIVVGGKTGSAETVGAAHAWFVCVAPLDNPQIAVCVMVEHGKHGATAAAPIARAMMVAYFKLKNAGAAVRTIGD